MYHAHMTAFDGFPPEVFTFFDEIRTNNNKEWFEAHKPFFKKTVQHSAQNFVMALGARLETAVPAIHYDTRLTGSGSIMRIYRDTRFSKDKTPYKTNLGIVWWEGDGKKTESPGFYFHMAADEVWFGGGLWHLPDVGRYREAVDDPEKGARLTAVVAQMAAAGHPITMTDPYKRVPRGYDKEHPRAELLKARGLTVSFPALTREIVSSAGLVDVCFAYAQKMLPLHQWLVAMMNDA